MACSKSENSIRKQKRCTITDRKAVFYDIIDVVGSNPTGNISD